MRRKRLVRVEKGDFSKLTRSKWQSNVPARRNKCLCDVTRLSGGGACDWGSRWGWDSPASWIVCPTLGILFLRATTTTFNLLLFSPMISSSLFGSLFGDPPPIGIPPGRKLLPLIAIARCNPGGTYRTVSLVGYVSSKLAPVAANRRTSQLNCDRWV